MASPNIGQTEDISIGVKGISGEKIKNIIDLTGKTGDTIYSLLFSLKENGEKKNDEQ